MVQQVFLLKKSVLHLSWTWDPQIWHLQNSTSKVCHLATARHHLWDGWNQIFFRWSLGTQRCNMGKMGDMARHGPQRGRENHGLGCEWHVFFWAFDSIFRWTYWSHCYLLLHSNNTQLWWLQHGQRSSPETGSPGFRKNSWHLDNFRHQDPQVATHFINMTMTKSQIINSNMKLVWQVIRRLSNTLRLRLDSPIFCPLRAAPSKIAVATGLKSTLKSQLLQPHVSSRVLGYTTVLICSSPRELTMFWASKHWKISPRKIMCSSFLGPEGLSPKSASLQLLSQVVICWLSFISLVYIGVALFCRCGVVFVCRMLSSFPFGMLSPPKKWQGHDYNMFWPQPVLTRFL